MSHLYLGVDGGQSSTTALIADATGRVLGYGRGGPCNHVAGAEGRAKFFRAVGECLQEACARVGLDFDTVRFASCCLGFSGGVEDKEAYARDLIRSARYKITHDADIALAGALEGEPGIIVIAGTGSMAFGRNAEGQTGRAGGWGYVFGDEGGAFDLVRRALRAALAFEEGWGMRTTLHHELLQAFRADSANQLLHRFYTDMRRSEIASYAPLVSRAAADGDAAARDILARAAGELARYVGGVHTRLFQAAEEVSVAPVGGVFRDGLLKIEFAKRVRELMSADVESPRFSPAAGALLEALQTDGQRVRLTDMPESEK